MKNVENCDTSLQIEGVCDARARTLKLYMCLSIPKLSTWLQSISLSQSVKRLRFRSLNSSFKRIAFNNITPWSRLIQSKSLAVFLFSITMRSLSGLNNNAHLFITMHHHIMSFRNSDGQNYHN